MESANVHDLTKIIGKCGKFQVGIALTVNLANLIGSWGMLFMAFGIYNPGWTCMDRETFNISSSLTFNTTMTYDLLYSRVDNNINDTKWILGCAVNKKCKHILFNPESSTLVSQWHLYCDLAWVPSLLVSIQMVGVFVGSYFSGQIGDKLGRKVSLYGHLAFQGISHVLAVFSVSWQMYAIMIFLVGFNVGGILSVAFPFVLEFMNEYWRGIITAVPVWNIGATLFALVVYILRDWRHVHIASAVASGLIFLSVFWSPESVRWLTVSGKVEKAKATVARIARVNGRSCPDTQVIDEIALEEKTKMRGHNYTYLDMFKIKSIRGYSIKFGLIWIILAVTYYVISFGIKALSGNFYLNFILFSVFECPTMLTVAPMVNKFGRRATALIYFSIATTCSVSVVIVTFQAYGDVKDVSILAFALILKSVLASAWAVIAVFSSELFPTVVRSLHYGYVNAISRVGAIAAPYLIPNNPNKLYVPFLVIGILLLVNCTLTYSMPDSKGKMLPDRTQDDDLHLKPMQPINEKEKQLISTV